MRIIDADGHVDEKNIPWPELLEGHTATERQELFGTTEVFPL